jgi:outer membrane protein assembly factor BamD
MFVAAIERANYLIKTYPQAPNAQQALAIVYHANTELGLKDAASDALKVYQDTYQSIPPEKINQRD